MGEEYDPVVADEFVEVDGAGGRFGLEIGGSGAKAETLSGGIFKSVQSILIIDIIQRGHCITYGAGRCSDEAILTVFFFLFFFFDSYKIFCSVGGEVGQRRKTACIRRSMHGTYVSYKYIIYVFFPPPFVW